MALQMNRQSYFLVFIFGSILCSFADHCLQQRGDEEKLHLWTDHDQHAVVLYNELRGVEQERGAGNWTSHQTLEGETFIY